MGMLTFDTHQPIAGADGKVKEIYPDGSNEGLELKKAEDPVDPEIPVAAVAEAPTEGAEVTSDPVGSDYDSVGQFVAALRKIPATSKHQIAGKVRDETGIDLDREWSKTKMIERAREAYLEVYGS